MVGRTPREAFSAHINKLHRALGCVTERRLRSHGPASRSGDEPIVISLNNQERVSVTAPGRLGLVVGEVVRIERGDAEVGADFVVRVVQYTYALSTTADDLVREVLAFH